MNTFDTFFFVLELISVISFGISGTMAAIRKGLDAYAGETLQEKVESYLLSIGVTKLQLESIQAIMCGGIAD